MKDERPVLEEKLIRDVYQRGYELEQRYYGCAQCVVGSIQDFFPINGVLFKAATSFSGGFASTIEGPCGALTGGIIVLSYFFGRSRDEFSNIGLLRRPGPLVREYWNKFNVTYGGDTCRKSKCTFLGKLTTFSMVMNTGSMRKQAGIVKNVLILSVRQEPGLPKCCWPIIFLH